MRGVFLFALFLGTIPATAAGRQQLFNGKDLDGWTFLGRGGSDGFGVEKGLLRTHKKGKGMLWYTRQKFGNGTLRVVWKMDNSKPEFRS